MLNIATDELEQAEAFPQGVHWFEFLLDGRLLVGKGSCSNEVIHIYDVQTEESLRLGAGGNRGPKWNTAHTKFIMNETGWEWIGFPIWAYDIEEDRLFFSTEDTLGPAYWMPDGLSLIYRHGRRSYMDDGHTYTLSPGAIHIVDVSSGEERSLVSDPQYSYYFCTSGDCILDEEWLLVWRIPYTPSQYTNDSSYNWEADSEGRNCVENVNKCEGPIESLWLNWRTGELLPYEQLPGAPTLTPAPLPPELDTP